MSDPLKKNTAPINFSTYSLHIRLFSRLFNIFEIYRYKLINIEISFITYQSMNLVASQL